MTQESFVVEGPVEVAVLVVTFHNEDDVAPLVACLRAEAARHRVRVVIVDNDSADASHERAASHDDVVAVQSGVNGGYSHGLNVAAAHAGEAEALLVLNPDLTFEPGLLSGLLSRLRSAEWDVSARDTPHGTTRTSHSAHTKGPGIVVPRILDEHGHVTRSLRREPTLAAAIGDALVGARLSGRPARWSETNWRAADYERAHRIDWATGAVLLVGARAAAAIGPWDEGFFLYSEETDYFRRVRDAGFEVWYEPSVAVTHRQGGSGGSASPRLTALMAVNQVAYYRRHHGALATLAFRVVAAARCLLRVWQPAQRRALSSLVRGLDADGVLAEG